MNFRNIFLSSLMALGLSQAANAQQAYVSGSVGQGHIDVSCSGLPDCKNNDTSFRIAAGLPFGNGFGAEVGYISFGKATASMYDPYYGYLSASIKASALTLAATVQGNIAPDWAFVGRLGVASVKTDVAASTSYASGSDNQTKSKFYYGAGLTYSLSKQTAIELGADFTEGEYAGETASLRALNLGVRFSF